MKNHKRLKLPVIGDGTLVADADARHDFYDSLSIEHESSEWSSYSSDISDETSCSSASSQTKTPVRGRRLTNLKAVANAIIAQRCWAKTVMKSWKNELNGAFYAEEMKEEGKSITFNPNAFKAHIQACGKLSLAMKMILRKYSGHRTADEVETVNKLVRRLRCFDLYSPAVKNELGRIIYYDSFEDGRLVIRQGQLGISFYFVVSGTVIVDRIEIDKQTGSRHIQRVDELGPGCSFGELALLHSNTKRAASMICKGSCEFLRIDRGEFEDIVKMIRERERQARAVFFNELEVFSDFSTKDRVVLNNNAKIETFWPNKVILGGNTEMTDRIYVITSGTCNIIQQLTVIKRRINNKKYKFILPSEEFLKQIKRTSGNTGNRGETVETFYLIISQLGVGDAFSLGEDLKDIFYVSDRKVSVISFAKMSMTRQLEIGKSLDKVKEKYAVKIPSKEEIFKDFMAEVKWKTFKGKIVNQAINHSKNYHKINRRANSPSCITSVTKMF